MINSANQMVLVEVQQLSTCLLLLIT